MLQALSACQCRTQQAATCERNCQALLLLAVCCKVKHSVQAAQLLQNSFKSLRCSTCNAAHSASFHVRSMHPVGAGRMCLAISCLAVSWHPAAEVLTSGCCPSAASSGATSDVPAASGSTPAATEAASKRAEPLPQSAPAASGAAAAAAAATSTAGTCPAQRACSLACTSLQDWCAWGRVNHLQGCSCHCSNACFFRPVHVTRSCTASPALDPNLPRCIDCKVQCITS